MKAVVLEEIGGPAKLRIADIATPEPGPGEVRIRLMASALNRRDYWITVGEYPGIRLPCVPGSDGAGVVDKAGPGVDAAVLEREVIVYPARGWGEDERAQGPEFRVLGMPDQGTFAEYICVPEGEYCAKPGYLGWEEAAAVPVGGLTAWRAVTTQGGVSRGQRVLVTGAGGGVAGFAILWCLHLGAEVYVSSGSDAKIAQARALGAAGGVDYRDEEAYARLAKETGRFDVVIDSAGGDEVNRLLNVLRPGGRYVFYGATHKNPSRGLEMAKLFFRQIRLQGTTMGTPGEFATMMSFMEDHRIKPVIDRVLPLDEAADAHALMADFRQTGKIVLRNR